MSPYRGRIFPGGLAPCPRPAEVTAEVVLLMVRWGSCPAQGWRWFSSLEGGMLEAEVDLE